MCENSPSQSPASRTEGKASKQHSRHCIKSLLPATCGNRFHIKTISSSFFFKRNKYNLGIRWNRATPVYFAAKVNELDFREDINCVESDEECSVRSFFLLTGSIQKDYGFPCMRYVSVLFYSIVTMQYLMGKYIVITKNPLEYYRSQIQPS